MSKVTSKLQITVPKALADRLRLKPGDEVDWEAAGSALRVVPRSRPAVTSLRARLKAFDQATTRQEGRRSEAAREHPTDRGWKREELYERGRTR